MIARADSSPKDLGIILERYWRPVYLHLRSTGRNPDDAADLTQAFFTERLVDCELLRNADRTRGRFRSYLLQSLKRFVIDEHRRERGRDNHRPRTIPTGELESVEAMFRAAAKIDPEEMYHREWARSLLSRACTDVRDDCVKRGMERQWQVYESRILLPAEHGCTPAPVEELIARFDLRDREELDNMVLTIRRKLIRGLRGVIAETVEDDADIDCELAELGEHLRAMNT